MSEHPIVFFFDYVDPLSYLFELRLKDAEEATGVRVSRSPLEVAVPPYPLIDPFSALWSERLKDARALRLPDEPELATPRIIPWTRKAHELVAHARETEGDAAAGRLRSVIFRSFHERGSDIGRVDLLLDIASQAGLDRAAAKVALDVDLHARAVAGARRAAERLGVEGVPSLRAGPEHIAGLPHPDALRGALRSISSSPQTEP